MADETKGVLTPASSKGIKSTGNSGQDELRGEGIESATGKDKDKLLDANHEQSAGLAKLERDGDQEGATRDAKTDKASAPIGTIAVEEDTPDQPGAAVG